MFFDWLDYEMTDAPLSASVTIEGDSVRLVIALLSLIKGEVWLYDGQPPSASQNDEYDALIAATLDKIFSDLSP